MKRSKNKTLKIEGWKARNGTRVRVTLNVFKGEENFSIREWYESKATGKIEAGKRGINLPLGKLTKVIDALSKAREVALSDAWRNGRE